MEDGLEARRLECVRSYVADVLGCAPDRVGTITRFEDGNRHDVYLASHLDDAGSEQRLVVRVSLADDCAEREQTEREAIVLERLAGEGAPQLVDVRRSSPWFETPVLCMRFVHGRSRELRSSSSAGIERLGSVVASVHAQPADDLADSFGETGTIQSYAEGRLRHILHGLPWARPPLPDELCDGLRHAAEVIRGGWEDRREGTSFRTAEKQLALLHGDIAFGNVLWGPDPVLIDWEYVRMGDPADEIAYLFDQNGLDAGQREAFWRGYRAGAGSDASLAGTMERVTWWEPLTLLGSTLWWAERFVRRVEAQAEGTTDAAVPKDDRYYLEQARNRFERLARLLEPS